MNTMNNQKVMEVLEKTCTFNYYDKIVHAKTRKLTLFSIFPYTAAANLSDPRQFVLIEDLQGMLGLNTGKVNN
ncbi:MAG: hypothetical protein WCW67_00590 [Candidatus Margulisiibacteriota bacterium]